MAKKVLALKVWGLLVLCSMFWGCEVWEQYVRPDYSASRAERLCHPFGECTQGHWVHVGKSEIDAIVDYDECGYDYEHRYGKWGSPSVSTGLEMGECMKSKGYTLMR